MAASSDPNVVKRRQRKMWASGDYAAVGSRILLLSEMLCEAADVRSGEKALDVACGNGNAALAAARRFATVIGVDNVPAALECARRRARAEGLDAAFVAADAEHLPFADGSFDIVLSVVGAMFAPRQEHVAAELLRVCRDGGRIGMVNWRMEGFLREMFVALSRYDRRASAARHAASWGEEDRLCELFGPRCVVKAERRIFRFRFHSPEHYVEFMCDAYGPYVELMQDMDEGGRRALKGEMLEVVRRANVSGGRDLVLPLEYLAAVILKPDV